MKALRSHLAESLALPAPICLSASTQQLLLRYFMIRRSKETKPNNCKGGREFGGADVISRLICIASASARLRLSAEASVDDALVAIEAVERTLMAQNPGAPQDPSSLADFT